MCSYYVVCTLLCVVIVFARFICFLNNNNNNKQWFPLCSALDEQSSLIEEQSQLHCQALAELELHLLQEHKKELEDLKWSLKEETGLAMQVMVANGYNFTILYWDWRSVYYIHLLSNNNQIKCFEQNFGK